MHRKTLFAIALAFAWCAVPVKVQAQTANSQFSGNAGLPSARNATAQAAQMVPAQAVLAQSLDSNSVQPDEQFKAVLTGKIRLKNGVELPKGTALLGTAVTESTPEAAKAKLALRFTQADLKRGKTIPIEATIVSVSPPVDDATLDTDYYSQPDPWDGKSLTFDAAGVLSGVDLHSRVGGENSGVFMSTKNTDMKLAARTQIALAIGAPETNGMNGGF